MGNNKNSTLVLVWAGVIVVAIIGGFLIINSQNPASNQPANTPAANPAGQSSSATRTKATATAKMSTNQTAPPAVTAPTKPSGNVVQLTANGFSPAVLEIKRGESVEFLNSSDQAMIIHGMTNTAEETYPGFSQESGPLGRSGKFFFAFTTPGTWKYYNLNTGLNGPRVTGTIIVQ